VSICLTTVAYFSFRHHFKICLQYQWASHSEYHN